MKDGSSTSDITPDIGIPLRRFAIRRNRPSVAIVDPLSVKVIAIEDHGKTHLFLGYELISFNRSVDEFLEDLLLSVVQNTPPI